MQLVISEKIRINSTGGHRPWHSFSWPIVEIPAFGSKFWSNLISLVRERVMGELTGKRKPQPKRLVLSPKLLQSTLLGLFTSLIGAKLATSLFLRQAQTRSSNTLHLMPSSFTILYPIWSTFIHHPLPILRAVPDLLLRGRCCTLFGDFHNLSFTLFDVYT